MWRLWILKRMKCVLNMIFYTMFTLFNCTFNVAFTRCYTCNYSTVNERTLKKRSKVQLLPLILKKKKCKINRFLNHKLYRFFAHSLHHFIALFAWKEIYNLQLFWNVDITAFLCIDYIILTHSVQCNFWIVRLTSILLQN